MKINENTDLSVFLPGPSLPVEAAGPTTELLANIEKDLQFHSQLGQEAERHGADFGRGRNCGIEALVLDIRQRISRAVPAPPIPVEAAGPYLVNHADGVDGSYCIARRVPDNPAFEEYWHKGKWAGAGEVFKLHAPRKAVPAPPADTAHCKRCRGTKTISVKVGQTFETDSADEIANAYRNLPCPECSKPPADMREPSPLHNPEIFVAEYEDGSLVDDTGDGGWSAWFSRSEAQDAADNDTDNPSTVVRYVRVDVSAQVDTPAMARLRRMAYAEDAVGGTVSVGGLVTDLEASPGKPVEQAVHSCGGEHQYFMIDVHGTVALMPAEVVESAAKGGK